MNKIKEWIPLMQKRDKNNYLVFDEIGEKYKEIEDGIRPIVITNTLNFNFNQYTKMRGLHNNITQHQNETEVLVDKNPNNKNFSKNEYGLLYYNSLWETTQILIAKNDLFNELIDYDNPKNKNSFNLTEKSIKNFAEILVKNLLKPQPNLSIVRVYKDNNGIYKGESLYLSDEKINELKNKPWFNKDTKIYEKYYNNINWDKYNSIPDFNNKKSFIRYENGIYVSLNYLNMFIEKKIYDNKIIDEFFRYQNLNKKIWDSNKIICPLDSKKIYYFNNQKNDVENALKNKVIKSNERER